LVNVEGLASEGTGFVPVADFDPVSSHWNALEGNCVEIQGTDAKTWEHRGLSHPAHPVTTIAFAMASSMPEFTFHGAQDLKRDIPTIIRMPNDVEEDMEKNTSHSGYF
jgi:hypothetical protein